MTRHIVNHPSINLSALPETLQNWIHNCDLKQRDNENTSKPNYPDMTCKFCWAIYMNTIDDPAERKFTDRFIYLSTMEEQSKRHPKGRPRKAFFDFKEQVLEQAV